MMRGAFAITLVAMVGLLFACRGDLTAPDFGDLGSVASAAKPDKGGKPKTPGTANFSGDLVSSGDLNGIFNPAKNSEVIIGELTGGETLTVGGKPGKTLARVDAEHFAHGHSSVLPPEAKLLPEGCPTDSRKSKGKPRSMSKPGGSLPSENRGPA